MRAHQNDFGEARMPGSDSLFDLASTIAVLALVAVPYGIALRRISSPRLRNVALGVLFSLTAMGAMLHPVRIETGIIVDLRALPIGLAGGFFGPLGALPAMAMAGVTRAVLGGAGTLSGIAAILIAGVAGVAWYYLARVMRPVLTFRLLVLSLMISLSYLAVLMLPDPPMTRIMAEMVPVAVVFNVIGTMVVGGLLDRERCSAELELALSEETMRDPLTGIANRRGFERLVEKSADRRANAPGGGSALLVIDLDHFKAVNDTYGHEAGDRVLRQLGTRLEGCLRAGDIVARFGGEEFVIFLPATPIQAAMAVAERLRRAIADESFVLSGTKIRATVSIGAHWEESFAQRAAAFASADRALYLAKSKGRNCVVFDNLLADTALAA
jgi:diguanylate cyclase